MKVEPALRPTAVKVDSFVSFPRRLSIKNCARMSIGSSLLIPCEIRRRSEPDVVDAAQTERQELVRRRLKVRDVGTFD